MAAQGPSPWRQAGHGIGGYKMFSAAERYGQPRVRVGSSGIALEMIGRQECRSSVAPDWDTLLMARDSRYGTTTFCRTALSQCGECQNKKTPREEYT